MSTPSLLIVIASTRPGRVGLPVGRWFEDRVRADGRFRVDVADLAEMNLPFHDEPDLPRLRRYLHDHTKAWSARVDAADAVVFVMPEYNHGYSAPLKNALDYLSAEWASKPAGFVSYGGASGGTRAVQALKPVLTGLKMMPIPEAVAIVGVHAQLVDGRFDATPATEQAAATLIEELLRWSRALAAMREPASAVA